MYTTYPQAATQPTTGTLSIADIETDHTPSLSSSALLVELTISTWAARKKDKQASRDVNYRNNANAGTANVTKKLLGDCEELKAVTSYAEVIRDYHRHATLPWSKGAELLANDKFLDYNRTMEQMVDKFHELVEDFVTAYNWEKQVAQTKLGKLYDPNEYPTADSIRKKFSVSFGYMNVPERGDLRVDISAAAKEVLEEAHRKHYDRQVATMMKGICDRIIDPLQQLADNIDFGVGDKKKRIYDTTVQHAKDLLEILKMCNVMKDPNIERVRLDIARAMEGVTTDGLRNSHHLRAKTKRNIDDIVNNLPSLGF